MSSEPDRIVTFRGDVSCRRDPDSTLGLTLVGRATDHPDETVSLVFAGVAPDGLPDTIEDAAVERIGARRYRISSSQQEWTVEATAVHLHRDVATAFYRAIPPRPAPWSKRLFWRVVLAMVASPMGKRVLLALRRR